MAPQPSDSAESARALPSGTVTFVFTDIEGSTRLAHSLGTERWSEVLAQHAAVIRPLAEAHEGVVVRTEGDSFFLAFRSARQAVAFAADAQRRLLSQPWAHGASVKVRIGMHTGENARPGTDAEASDYVGYDVHRAARVSSAGHGGQVLLSSVTRTLLGEELPDGVSLRDLGEVRLKDLNAPDRLYQLVIEGSPAEFPPLRGAEGTPNNLPVQLTSFVGRARELAAAERLLEGTRLLTLVGPGGTGKTRLSLELAARSLDRFPDGVWFVRLAAVSEPSLVATTIADTLGLMVPPGSTPLRHLIDHLRLRSALLVLDNFEQVVAAAPDVAEILRACQGVKAIVSTRIVLRVSGEQEYAVPPLALPDPGGDPASLAGSESVQLFVERARAARPDFALTEANSRAVAGIVAHLDGLPLAIELAAARVKLLAPQAILERLASGIGILQSTARDLPARQRTLRGAIAWSYDLLDEDLRRLFRRLAVFRGGASLDQIEAVCGPPEEIGRDVLDGVAELLDQSLLRRVDGEVEERFLMLETIREYAREALDASGEAAEIDLRHARAYLALAESYAPRLLGSEQRALLDRLERENGNLRAALDICAQTACAAAEGCTCPPEEHKGDDERVEVSLRLVSALWRFWQMRGRLHEGRQRAERVLALPRAQEHADAYIGALEAAGGITYWMGDLEATERHYSRRLALARDTGDPVKIGNALYDLSFVFTVSNTDIPRGQELLDESLALLRSAGDSEGAMRAQWALSTNYVALGEWQRSADLLPEVLETFRRSGNLFQQGWALHNLGLVQIRLGRHDEARRSLSEAVGIFRAADDRSGFVLLLHDFAELAAAEGRVDRALRLYAAGAAEERRTGVALAEVWSGRETPFTLELRALLDRTPEGVKAPLLAQGAALSVREAVEYALSDRDAL